MTQHSNKSPQPSSEPKYSARMALSCQPNQAPGPVLHALQELRSVIDDRLRQHLERAYDRHRTQSVGEDKLTVVFTLHAGTPANAIRAAGLAAATLIEILTDIDVALDLTGVALVVRAE